MHINKEIENNSEEALSGALSEEKILDLRRMIDVLQDTNNRRKEIIEDLFEFCKLIFIYRYDKGVDPEFGRIINVLDAPLIKIFSEQVDILDKDNKHLEDIVSFFKKVV